MNNKIKDYSFYVVKMMLYQAAISILGLTLSLAFSRSKSLTGQIVSSVCAVLLYLFLLYCMTWEIGYKDRPAIRRGEIKENVFTGLILSLCANFVNFVFAVLNVCRVGIAAFAILFEGMYAGIAFAISKKLSAEVPVWFYFAVIVPSLVITTVSYIMGLKDKAFTPILRSAKPGTEKGSKKD